ncbi:MAG: putative repair protein [Acidobacteriaceae bacterium]|nr:putative repair protein [Acidobacteriaceae bacterium]
MDSEDLLPAEVVAALERGATVVTVNQRAARTLRLGYDRRNRMLGRRSWQPAQVLAWDAWLSGWWSRLLLEGLAAQMLLNRSQELSVWRDVLEEDSERQSLRGMESLAEMGAKAWTLLCGHNGRGRLREIAVSTDTRAFQRWAQAFERRCRNEGYLAQANLADEVRKGVASGAFEAGTGEVVLVGFDTMTPSQAGLIEALRDAGVVVEELQLAIPAGDRLLIEATDGAEELRACALWVKSFLADHPDGRVGVIVPGLEAQVGEIDRVFREVLAPELEAIGAGPGPYEFSVGEALASTPMALVALDLLHWVNGALPVERVSALLLSPYFADGRGALSARAEFDAFGLRRAKMLRPEISLEEMAKLVEQARGLEAVSAALRRMRQVVARRFSKDDTLTYAEWAEGVRELLEAAAWGAGRDEESVEYQARSKWEGVLDELATLDFDGRRVRFREALEGLERIAGRTMFAAESREAPVQVMGPLEAAGSRFDAVWFLQAGELSWPMTVSTSPLLPWPLQRELAMPGADPALEMDFARRVSLRVAESAGTAVFSYARFAGDEAGRQRPSAALDGLGLEATSAETILSRGVVREIIETEMVEDDVRLPALPDRVIRGGAALLAAQAACGFKAFAEQRLWSSEPDVAELGMDAAERGTLVHGVLELFWKNVKTQEELKAMTVAEREEMLDWCIREELRSAAARSATAWDVAYVDMERSRLHTLLGGWLELELERAPFEVKLSEMKFDDVRVGPLRLRVIVDRVDLVDDGGGEDGADATEPAEMIVDYKTGRAEPGQWLTDRPDAPQLPLYAVLSQASRIAGVAFAKVRLGEEMSLHGYATREELVTKLARLKDAPTLEAQVEAWRRVLTGLAEKFAAGDARVRPKKYPDTCEHCAQRLVCRLDVAVLDADMDEENGANDE